MAMSRSFESSSLTTRPSIAISPAPMSSRPASMRSSVDLPQPDGPTSTMNSPSAMSSEMPCSTFVAPKDFSIPEKETEAIRSSPLLLSCLYSPTCKTAHHVAAERVVDRGRRQAVDERGRHQDLPRRVVRGEEVPEADRERDGVLVREQQERVEVLVPREQQRIGEDRDQRRH